jgi:hypothetical protein
MRVGQIANRTGYTPGHVSEVLRDWKRARPRRRRPARPPDDGLDWARKGSLEIVSAELRIVISAGDDRRVDLADLGEFLKTL